ncbi:ATP-dependent DNA helicase RecG, partial [Francisellaceae bacterium]|nr:ATP-dependent DNA helicase RecG [Francisellaceae bacterium]
ETLHQNHIYSLEDLLLNFPKSYQDRTKIVPIHTLMPGQVSQVKGVIQQTRVQHFNRRKILSCEINDGNDSLVFKLFNFYPNQIHALAEGLTVLLYGEVRSNGYLKEMIHPEWKIIKGDIQLARTYMPVYQAIANISPSRINRFISQASQYIETLDFKNYIPKPIQQKIGLMDIKQAINYLHKPPKAAGIIDLNNGQSCAHQSIIFEELLAHCLSAQQVKQQYIQQAIYPLSKKQRYIKLFLEHLEFRLTESQQQVIDEIFTDMFSGAYLSRLIQGDVGSGKTVIAALAALPVIENGYQVILMAPTEILATQHFEKFLNWFKPLNLNVTLLLSKQSASEKKKNLSDITTGKASMIIGTHALFQKQVSFHKAALVIMDEQHRFGVEQRLELLKKGQFESTTPHQLILTATPIPRTLAMTIYGDLNVSTIDGLPPGRKEIKTVIVSNQREQEVVNRLFQHCQNNQQAYWVCPLVEDSEAENVEHLMSVETRYQLLSKQLSGINVGMVHGKMTGIQKQEIMRDFKENKIQLLVATTVIEVGVDVPNASIMIIENAERLGLSQLHQLRGRVGRGNIQSSCLLMYHHPISNESKTRLEVIRAYSNGFTLAEKDLELRGPGDFLGKNQTGDISFKVANLVRDQYLIDRVKEVADELIKQYPDAAEGIMKRWHKRHLEYTKV